MKKIYKLFIAATIVLMVGIGMLVAALAFAKFDLKNFSSDAPYSEYTYECTSDITKIRVDDYSTTINIEPGAVDHVTVEYMENENNKYDISENQNTLTFDKKQTSHWYDNVMNFRVEAISMQVTVPEDYSGTICIETSNAGVYVKDLDLAEAELATSNAIVEVENVTVAGNCSLNSSNGKINAESVSVDTLLADTSNSSLNLTDVTVTNDIRCSNSNGSMHLTNVTCKALDAKTSNGKMELVSVSVADLATLDNSNGGIDLTDVTAKNLDTSTSNAAIGFCRVDVSESLTADSSSGRISGSIVGEQSDFSINANTSNAKCNLPNKTTEGSKNLQVTTSNAGIEIEFVKR